MNKRKLLASMEAAREFLKAGNEVLEEQIGNADILCYVGTKATGNLRRKSLDLTRSLAELRKPS
jgi:hypothetical protein